MAQNCMVHFSSESHQEVLVWVLWAGGSEVEYFPGFGVRAPGWWEPVVFIYPCVHRRLVLLRT